MKKSAKWLILSAVGSLVSLGIGLISDVLCTKAAREIDEDEYQKDFEKRLQKYLNDNNYVRELTGINLEKPKGS